MRRMLRMALIIGTALGCASAWALDFRSMSEASVLYDAPSRQAKPLFIIARDTPVEAVVSLEGWVKVRDADGSIAWVERRALAERRTVIVTAARAQIRAQPDTNAPVAFEAEQSVLLEFVEAGPLGWAMVKHRDGDSGYVRVSEVWGL